jgi:DNA invertase Pin-like site-specific DNA recombinase
MPRNPIKYVAYYRVSTKQQGISGLDLEAQRRAVTDWMGHSDYELIGDFTEIESGRRTDRPEMNKALALCRKQKATLVIAVLDRLARNVAFISGLIESGVSFVAVDRPRASPFELYVYAAVAEEESRKLGERTKAALAIAKQHIAETGSHTTPHGTTITRLGPPNPAAAAARARQAVVQLADEMAAAVGPVIEQIQASGVMSLRGIASVLNARGIRTARGCQWDPKQVSRVLNRWKSKTEYPDAD